MEGAMSIFQELFSLQGKKAMVTGGATGIGRMIATALARAGADVLIASRKADDCVRVAAEIGELVASEDSQGSCIGFGGDVSTMDGVAALQAEIASNTDQLHILVNNAGNTWGEPLESFPYEAWSRVFNLNVTGLFNLTRDCLPLLRSAATKSDPAGGVAHHQRDA